MEEEASESCFCSETLDILRGIGSELLQHIYADLHLIKLSPQRHSVIFFYVNIFRSYLHVGRSLTSPVSASSLFRSLLISRLISLCWRSRASSLALMSSQDLERESGWPCDKPTWFNMPSEHDILFMFRLRARYTDMYLSMFSSEEIEGNVLVINLSIDLSIKKNIIPKPLLTWYQTVVQLSWSHLAVELVLCRAEVQEILCYFWTLCDKTVLFPTWPTTLDYQLTTLRSDTKYHILFFMTNLSILNPMQKKY